MTGEAKKCRVFWRDSATGMTGHGELMEIWLAEGWAERKNLDHPTIQHWTGPIEEPVIGAEEAPR